MTGAALGIRIQRTDSMYNPDERIVSTAHGAWRVYEYHSRLTKQKPPVLVFEHRTMIRVVREYPTDWRTLSDAQLLILLEDL